jgi:hypothetical protein
MRDESLTITHCFKLEIKGPISTQENFVKCDWPTQIFRRKNFEVENVQLLIIGKIFCPWKFFLNGNGP